MIRLTSAGSEALLTWGDDRADFRRVLVTGTAQSKETDRIRLIDCARDSGDKSLVPSSSR
jgi:hypothetical protein